MPSAFPAVDSYSYPRSVPSYLSSVDPYKATSEQQIGSMQEKMRTIFEQIISLGNNIIESGDIKVYEASQLRELYIIKL